MRWLFLISLILSQVDFERIKMVRELCQSMEEDLKIDENDSLYLRAKHYKHLADSLYNLLKEERDEEELSDLRDRCLRNYSLYLHLSVKVWRERVKRKGGGDG